MNLQCLCASSLTVVDVNVSIAGNTTTVASEGDSLELLIFLDGTTARDVSVTVSILPLTAQGRYRALLKCSMSCTMKSTKMQTSPIYLNHALKHLPQSEPRAILGSKYAMATPIVSGS